MLITTYIILAITTLLSAVRAVTGDEKQGKTTEVNKNDSTDLLMSIFGGAEKRKQTTNRIIALVVFVISLLALLALIFFA